MSDASRTPLDQDPEPAGAPSAAKRTDRRTIAVTAAAVVGWLVAAVFAALWVGASSDADEATDQLEAIAAEEAARPDLSEAVERHGFDTTVVERSDANSVSLNFEGFELEDHDNRVRELLTELGFNASAVMDRFGNTRALDGTQTDESDKARISWSYHPDDGLSVVLSIKD